MKPAISVIICTHNPRPDYLSQVLAQLKAQTLPQQQWELILVDNASDRSLASEVDLTWHQQAHPVCEEKLGLTHARLRGIQASQADLLIFIDDDNVLAQDYLEVALNISQNYPMLGAWGGQSLPKFEVVPPEWTQPFWSYLALRQFDQDRWSDSLLWEATPIGAGLCLRRQVAERYGNLVRNDSTRLSLGRKGQFLTGHEDVDLAYTSSELGLGTGIFVGLKLTHLIPVNRVQEEYLFRLAEGTGYSEIMVEFKWGKLPSMLSWKRRLRLLMPWLIHPAAWFTHPKARQFIQAATRGRVAAMREILKLEESKQLTYKTANSVS